MKKFIITICLLATSNLVTASNGVFAINSVCDGFGCFPGDSAGLPITITNAGSYQLTSNLISSSTTVNVIEINANNVTLDLNGFSIIGPRTCSGFNGTLVCIPSSMTANGIQSSGRFNTVVRNGIVKGFDAGVSFTGNSSNVAISHITADGNSSGIVLSGTGTISNCITNRNLGVGISGVFSTILINDTMAMGNRNGPLLVGAGVCSNVLFNQNGSVNDFCARYTNGSTCEGLVACP